MNLKDDIFIERYLRNELSAEELQSFTERLHSDADFQAQVTLEKQLLEALDEKSWSFVENKDLEEIVAYESIYKSSDTHKIKKAIEKAQNEYNEAQQPTRNWLFYISAAAAIVLFSILMLNPEKPSNQELYASYLDDTSLLSLVSRGGYDSIFDIAQTSFDQQKYEKVVQTLSTVADSIQSGNVYIYLAISQIQLEQYTEAESTLNNLINSNLLDSQKGYWYKSLMYLKADQIDKSKNELQIIIDSSFYQLNKAKELLNQLQ